MTNRTPWTLQIDEPGFVADLRVGLHLSRTFSVNGRTSGADLTGTVQVGNRKPKMIRKHYKMTADALAALAAFGQGVQL